MLWLIILIKTSLSPSERIEMIEDSTQKYHNIKAIHYSGLIVDYAKECNAVAVVRGLRQEDELSFKWQ